MDNYARLVDRIKRALLDRGMVVPLGEFMLRHLLRGEEFTDEEGNHLQALQTGIFIRLICYTEGGPSRGRWVHFGSSEHLYDRLLPYVDGLTSDEFRRLDVALAANAALHSMRPGRGVSANDEPIPRERMRG